MRSSTTAEHGGAATRSARRSKNRASGARTPFPLLLFLWIYILFEELYLHISDGCVSSFSIILLLIFTSAAFSGFLTFISWLLPHKKAAKIFCGVVLFLFTAYTCIQHCCHGFYMSYFSIASMLGLAGQVAVGFTGTLFDVIRANIAYILVSVLPLIIFILLSKYLLPVKKNTHKAVQLICILLIAVVMQLLCSLTGHVYAYSELYTYGFEVNDSLGSAGAANCIRLELQYSIFGKPAMPVEDFETEDEPSDPQQITSEPAIVEIEYNTMDIDFDTLIASETDETILSMHKYFNSLPGTAKNSYTGKFKGKNLIMICCEAFSPYFISEELTPALYRLTTEGFRFNNFYQPLTGQSTTGGEYEMLIGNIPAWVKTKSGGSVTCLKGSADKYLPFTMANALNKVGYASLGWHDNVSTYYGRNKSHPNLGYYFRGTENGLNIKANGWASDVDMFKATVHEYIDNYLDNHQLFNAYYMSISGHGPYSWSHNMARKNKDVAQAAFPDYSEEAQAYVAASLEIEYALEYLLDELEAAGIADKTVIAMTADHYPYVLLDQGHYDDLTGQPNDARRTETYRNAFILWCGDGSCNQDIDTPCAAIDITPTLLNLFGLEYDSRLIIGRDIFADNYEPYTVSLSMPIAVIYTNSGYSWRTDLGVYETYLGKFIPNEGVPEVPEGYVDAVKKIVNNKKNFSSLILNMDYYRIVFGE